MFFQPKHTNKNEESKMEIEGLISVISLAGTGAFSSVIDSKVSNEFNGLNRNAWIDLFNRIKNVEAGKFIVRKNSSRRFNSMNLYGMKTRKTPSLKVKNAIPGGSMESQPSELNRETFRRLIWD
jgi:hypothetical protein